MTFTDSSIKRLQPRDLPYREYEGGEIPGFHLQITPAGTRTFYLQHTAHGRRRFYRLGAYPLLGLAAARQRARDVLATLEAGGDPRASAPLSDLGSVEELLSAWLAEQQDRGRRRLGDVERAIRGNCAAILRRPAAQVTASEIRTALAAIHQRGSRVMANRVRAHLHALWTYGMRHDHDPRHLHQAVRFGIEVNPVVAVPRDSEAERPRERVLTWAEVREVWNADVDRISWPARQAVRLLLYSGARVNEIVQARWEEFDLDAGLWTLPAERVKTKRPLLTPLTPLAIELLTELREAFPGSEWLFPGRNALNATHPWGATALGHAIRNGGYEWTGRDLRRTWKTLTGGIGLSLDIRDRIQGHTLPGVSSRHYDKHSYIDEKRAALLAWERELRARIAGENVLVMRRA